MSTHEHVSLVNPASQASEPAQAEKATPRSYQAPELFVIGAAADLVQGYGVGPISDGGTTRRQYL
jgi:hypothetical protein